MSRSRLTAMEVPPSKVCTLHVFLTSSLLWPTDPGAAAVPPVDSEGRAPLQSEAHPLLFNISVQLPRQLTDSHVGVQRTIPKSQPKVHYLSVSRYTTWLKGVLRQIHRQFDVFGAVPVEWRPGDRNIQPADTPAVELGLMIVCFSRTNI